MKCETCDSNYLLSRSHFVKTRHVHNSKRVSYDYESSDNYFIQCANCHKYYEGLNTKKKFDFDNETRQEYLRKRGLMKYADRVEWLIND